MAATRIVKIRVESSAEVGQIEKVLTEQGMTVTSSDDYAVCAEVMVAQINTTFNAGLVEGGLKQLDKRVIFEWS